MVEIIPKKTPPLPRRLIILFYFSLILLLFSIVSFFILGNLIKEKSKTLMDLKSTLIKARTSDKISLEKEILKYQSKTKDFSQIITEHLKTKKVFDILEKDCHPRVRFSQLNLNTRENQVSLLGYTDSFEILGQQLLLFRDDNFVENVNLEKVSLSKEGRVLFNLSLVFKPEVFK